MTGSVRSMKPGDPFETKALDELRSEQRRALRMVPDWLVKKHAPPQSVSVPLSFAGLLETGLRTEAAAAREQLGDLPDQFENSTGTEVLVQFVREHGTGVRVAAPGFALSRVFSRTITELEEGVSHREFDLPLEEVVSLTRYLHLLVWADDVAGDGYRDPRLADPPGGTPHRP